MRGSATYLIRVFDKNVLSFGLFHTKIGDSTNNTPAVVQRYIQLSSKVTRTN